jgi:chromosome segregation ATPase
MNHQDDTSRFTIRGTEAEPDAVYLADADNLRIEKLSTRVTLVAVLIPCLLVVVLVIAYLDIKNRVINTQHSGSMGVQNLSKDLESRFSNLSLKQAKMEEQLTETANALKTTTAALKISLNKATTEFKQIADDKMDRSALTALSNQTEASIVALQKDIADLNTAFGKFDEELANQILLMAEGLKKDQGRLAEIEKSVQQLAGIQKRVQQLDAEKLSRESMNLALGLERLGLQEMVKDLIRGVEKKLADFGKQLDALNQRLDAQAQRASPSSSASAAPATSPRISPIPPERPDPNAGSTGIVEQTIN